MKKVTDCNVKQKDVILCVTIYREAVDNAGEASGKKVGIFYTDISANGLALLSMTSNMGNADDFLLG
uniref:Peptidase_S8 domain-containing protein n=1 Tax=Syphacia muris TaxID=451379 RepID=A0A0N5APV8_9BILA